MVKYKAVIFDLDDTLYPEMDYVRSGFKVTAELISSVVGAKSKKIYEKLLKIFEENKTGVFDRILAFYGVNDKKLIKECVDTYRNHFPQINLTSETEELLQWLKAKGIKIGIITDGRPKGQWKKIQALGLEKYCDRIIVTDELGGLEYRKPCEVSYKKMLLDLDIRPEETIYVGDNPAKDFISANMLQMTTIMLFHANGIYKQIGFPLEYTAQHTVKTLVEIKEFLEDGVN
ncbi:HAD family hydrolase [Desulfotomaculum nigrificans]|uniref:HAD family hydrolase n=1 Tax=Desulfotomaculum nigrificans TaxID=1565 RepID=UPI0001FAE93C|nr:HAD-IA family hydrolase [Desulfotomaculum nigrificans]